jgi:hypothetical protein
MNTMRPGIPATGAEATAVADAPRARQGEQGAFYERGPVRIHFEEAGSGVPLLVIPGGD